MATKNAGETRFNAMRRRLFLDHLAETANVAASERAAGMAPRSAYAERRRSTAFRFAWAEALAEGYARLEADLLADVLPAASAKTSEATQKARAQKNRQGINLLNWHRTSVRSATPGVARLTADDLPALKLQLNLTLSRMRERAGIPMDGAAAGTNADHAAAPESNPA